MFDFHHLLAYGLVVLALQVVPGPAVLLTVTRSLTGGRKVGLATGLGIAVGDMLHTIMAALGLSAILMTSALAFEVIKYLGVAYLLVLGLRAFFQRTDADTAKAGMAGLAGKTGTAHHAFFQAILAELLNPKTALFFLAFLPQFLQPAAGAVTLQLLLLGGIFVVLSVAVTSALVLSASFLRRRTVRAAGLSQWRGKIIGGLYIGLGVRLALQQRS